MNETEENKCCRIATLLTFTRVNATTTFVYLALWLLRCCVWFGFITKYTVQYI